MIGVGAMVFKSVSPGFKVIGHPAKVYGKDQTKNELIKFSETDNNELVKKSLS